MMARNNPPPLGSHVGNRGAGLEGHRVAVAPQARHHGGIDCAQIDRHGHAVETCEWVSKRAQTPNSRAF